MQRYQDSILIQSPTTLSTVAGVGLTVKVYNVGTAVLAAIYSDNGVTLIDQATDPIISDAVGNFFFYAEDGRYDITISGPSIATFTVNDVLLEDLADFFGANYADAGGTVDAITADYPDAPTNTLKDGYPFLVHLIGPNTGINPTFTPTIKGVTQTTRTIKKYDSTGAVVNLTVGELSGVVELIYDAGALRYIARNFASKTGDADQSFTTKNLTVTGTVSVDVSSANAGLAVKNSGAGLDAILGHNTAETIGGINQYSQIHNVLGGALGISRWIANASGVAVATLKSRSSTKGVRTTLVNNDVLFQLDNYGVDASGTPADARAAQMLVQVDAAPGAGIVRGRYTFNTADAAGTLQPALKIDSAQLITSYAGIAITGGVLDLPSYTTGTRPTAASGNLIYDTTLNKACIGVGAGTWEVITSV